MLGSDHAAVVKVLADRVREQLPLLIMLDGLDERPPGVAEAFVRLAEQMRTDSGNVALLFSARWRPEQALDANLRADIFEVLRLTPDRAEELMARYFEAAGVGPSRDAAKTALDHFAGSDLWRDVAGNPMSLLLFAPAVQSLAPEIRSSGMDPAGQMLRVLLRRRESTRALADQPFWEWPIGHIAVHMVQKGIQQIDSLSLHEELQMAYAHLQARYPRCALVQSPDYGFDRYAMLMLECGLLRLRVAGTTLTAGQPLQYDFFSDQIRDWLSASAIVGGWSPQSSEAMSSFIDSEDHTVRGDRRDQLLELICLAEPGTAASRLDQLMTYDNDFSLATVLQAMASGRAPHAGHDDGLIERVVARIRQGNAGDRELLLAFAADYGPPHRIPRPWGVISGLWLNLPANRPSDFSLIVQRGWLGVGAYVAEIDRRIRGEDGGDACAAMFEVLEFAFSISPYPLNEIERTALEAIAASIAAQLVSRGQPRGLCRLGVELDLSRAGGWTAMDRGGRGRIGRPCCTCWLIRGRRTWPNCPPRTY